MAANGQAAPADKSPFSNFIDHDGEMKLDLEEFIEMQPVRIREIHTCEQMHQWFKDADGNGDGKLSINEFFTCALRRKRLRTHGNGALCPTKIPSMLCPVDLFLLHLCPWS